MSDLASGSPGPVHVAIETGGTTRDAGTLRIEAFRGERVTGATFRYRTAYLADRAAVTLSPDLPLSDAPIPTAGLPLALQDAAPDAWGRRILRGIRRRRGAGTRLTELDALLGVTDEGRLGALRLRTAPDGAFESAAEPVPHDIEIAILLRAADAVARDPDDLAAVERLSRAGSGDLGGARPKALVRGEGGRLLLAKFPAPDDPHDVIRWEAATLELARRAGLRVATSRLVEVDGSPILLLDRFDRSAEGTRIPYWSARTLAEGEFGDYDDLADAIRTGESADPRGDIAELWRRVAFSVLVNNTDDHDRNHGFLRENHGWRLAPAFDINPDPEIGATRELALDGETGPTRAASALPVLAERWGIAPHVRRPAIGRQLAALADWRRVARDHGIPDSASAQFAEVFDGRMRARVEDALS